MCSVSNIIHGSVGNTASAEVSTPVAAAAVADGSFEYISEVVAQFSSLTLLRPKLFRLALFIGWATVSTIGSFCSLCSVAITHPPLYGIAVDWAGACEALNHARLTLLFAATSEKEAKKAAKKAAKKVTNAKMLNIPCTPLLYQFQ